MKEYLKFGFMNRSFYILFITAACLALCMSACYYDKRDALYPPIPIHSICDTTGISYSQHISVILSAHCTNCHNASLASGGHRLDIYSGVSAASSRIKGSINHSPGYSAMPQGGIKLNDCQILKIETWLLAGAPNN